MAALRIVTKQVYSILKMKKAQLILVAGEKGRWKEG